MAVPLFIEKLTMGTPVTKVAQDVLLRIAEMTESICSEIRWLLLMLVYLYTAQRLRASTHANYGIRYD